MEAHNYAVGYVLESCDDFDVPEELRKEGDGLLIDLVRSRPCLYDKTTKDYRDAGIKENAWNEIASVLELTPSECQTRFLRQKFSKEWQMRETKSRSGAGKSKRPSWVLYNSLKFLNQHVLQRRGYTNVGRATSKMNTELLQIPEQCTSQQTTQEAIVEEDEGTVCAADKQCVSADTSETMMSPRSCPSAFQRRTKRAKMDPVEVAFEQINTTLGKMADTFCAEGVKSCGEDPDVLIGKLMTAE